MLIARVPSQPVRNFVSTLWYAEDWRPNGARERIMPDATANLIISLDGSSPARAMIMGPRTEFATLRPATVPLAIIGAHFVPGGIAVLADVPISELRDRPVALFDLVGPSAAELRERLMQAATPEARLDLLETWLGLAIRVRAGADPAILWAARRLARPLARVADVAESVGYSGRWFAARFEREIGLTPKLFHRVRRFQTTLRLARRYASPDLADLAAAAGYHDQAHLSHEFVRLGGMSPSALLAARTEHLNHIADPS